MPSKTSPKTSLLPPVAVGDAYATHVYARDRLVIKEDALFLYSDSEGNLGMQPRAGFGLYQNDTRFLSRLDLTLNGERPRLLSATAERGFTCEIELTNGDFTSPNGSLVRQDTLSFRRRRVLRGALYESLRIKNYNLFPVEVSLELRFGADFADMFEVRGFKRRARGILLAAQIKDSSVVLPYKGLDGVARSTCLIFDSAPAHLTAEGAVFIVKLGAREEAFINYEVTPRFSGNTVVPLDYKQALSRVSHTHRLWESRCAHVHTDNAIFNRMVAQSQRDLRMLKTQTAAGNMITAGIPWYVAPFGRDGALAALQSIFLDPRSATETLLTFANLQGQKVDSWREEEPGKTFHEVRAGEMANLGEVPHTLYYGTADATALYLVLASAVFRWTGNRALAKRLAPSLKAALAWIDTYGDADDDGFVEYKCRSKGGLHNQGWKDSFDGVCHADGSQPGLPIALSEVQAYTYYAKIRMAEYFKELGEPQFSQKLEGEAQKLKERFDEAFWMEEEMFYALALDGQKQQVRSITSNPGHGFWAGIIPSSRSAAVARRLLSKELFSGFGIRTLGKSATHYNPMSYHNGSIWPHDNALIMRGLKKYGYIKEAVTVATALYDAASHYDYMRLPELYCGFARTPSAQKPVDYPVACSPQAWASGSMLMVLQSLLGIEADAPRNILYIRCPVLPPWLERVDLNGMRLGSSTFSLRFRRDGEETSVMVRDQQGSVRIVVED